MNNYVWNFIERHRGPFIAGSALALGFAASEYINSTRASRHVYPQRMESHDLDRYSTRRSMQNKDFKVIPIPTKIKPSRRAIRTSVTNSRDYEFF